MKKQYNGQPNTMQKTKNLKIQQREFSKTPGMNLSVPEE